MDRSFVSHVIGITTQGDFVTILYTLNMVFQKRLTAIFFCFLATGWQCPVVSAGELHERIGPSVTRRQMEGLQALPSVYDRLNLRKILITHIDKFIFMGDQLIPSKIAQLAADRFPDAETYVLARHPIIYEGEHSSLKIINPHSGNTPLEERYRVNLYTHELQAALREHQFDAVFILDRIFEGGERPEEHYYDSLDAPLTVYLDRFRIHDQQVPNVPKGFTLYHDPEAWGNLYKQYKGIADAWHLSKREDDHLPEWKVRKQDRLQAVEIFKANGLEGNKPTLLINPAASSDRKEIGTAGWEVLLEKLSHLIDFSRFNFIVSQGINKRHLNLAESIADIIKNASHKIAYEPLLPQFGVKELAAMVELSQGLLTVDTMAGHLGPAVGVPTFIVYLTEDLSKWKHPHAIGMYYHVGDLEIAEALSNWEVFRSVKRNIYP